MHSDGRDGPKWRRGVLLLASLTLAAACKKSIPAPSASTASPDLSMPSSVAKPSPSDRAKADADLEAYVAKKYANDPGKKEETLSEMRQLDAQVDAEARLAEEHRKTMVTPVPAGFQPDAASRKVRLALFLEKNRIKPGERLRFRLELVNVGREPIVFKELGGTSIFQGGCFGPTIRLYRTDPAGRRERIRQDFFARLPDAKFVADSHSSELQPPQGLTKEQEKKWFDEVVGSGRAGGNFEVRLLPGETLHSLGDSESTSDAYRTMLSKEKFVRPVAYKIEAVLDDRPAPLTKAYVDAMLGSGSTMKEIEDFQDQQMREALGPITSNAISFQVAP